MKKSLLIAGAALLAIGAPAIAAIQNGGPPPPMKDMTRADVEAKVKDHFTRLDSNKDGVITQAEIKAHHEAMRAERKDTRFKAMDKDGDGSISHAEFTDHRMGDRPDGKAHMKDGTPPPPRMGMRGDAGSKEGAFRPPHGKMGDWMFSRADTDKDGKITLAEATSAALAHFDSMDTNKDGTVTAAERMDFMIKMRGAHDKPVEGSTPPKPTH